MPKRVQGLVIQEIDNEHLVFNGEKSEGHALNEAAAAIFDLCDGETSQESMVAALSRKFGSTVDPDVVELALSELNDAGLLVDHVVAASGINRRSIIRKLGLTVAAATALPLVETIIVRDAYAQGSFGATGPTGGMGVTGATGP